MEANPLPSVTMKDQDEPGTWVVPLRNDIIFGRGTGQAKHPGNAKMKNLIDRYVARYAAATRRAQKIQMIQSIYNTLRASRTRFVDMDPDSGICFVASHETAKNKIGHAIRYRLDPLKKRAQRKERLLAKRQKKRANRNQTKEIEIFSNKELKSVLGWPGELDIPRQLPRMDSLEEGSIGFL